MLGFIVQDLACSETLAGSDGGEGSDVDATTDASSEGRSGKILVGLIIAIVIVIIAVVLFLSYRCRKSKGVAEKTKVKISSAKLAVRVVKPPVAPGQSYAAPSATHRDRLED